MTDRRERRNAASDHMFNHLYIDADIHPGVLSGQFYGLSGGTDAEGHFGFEGAVAL